MKFIAIRSALVLAILATFGTTSIAQDNKKSNVQDFTVGKPTQKVTPREMKTTVRKDGSTSIVTGQQRLSNGKIVGEHSHSVVKNGEVVSSRTAGGRYVPATTPSSSPKAIVLPQGARPVGGSVPSGDIRGASGSATTGGGMAPLKK